jgi:DNA-binding transcriptional LysR family regulator
VKTARAIASGERGELHVGYAPSPTVRILPPALRAFQLEAPKVRVKLHDLSTEEMLAGVRERKLDIALLVRPTRAMLRGLSFEELGRDAMCLAVAPNHALARLRVVTRARAAQEPLVAFSEKEYPEYHEYLDTLFRDIQTKPRIVEEHDSAAGLIAAIEAGSGVAVAPKSFACTAGPRLKLVPLTPEPEPLVIGAVWLKEGLTPTAERFLKSANHTLAS